jgi:hypothetical protein
VIEITVDFGNVLQQMPGTLLFGVGPADLVTFLFVSAILESVALFARHSGTASYLRGASDRFARGMKHQIRL